MPPLGERDDRLGAEDLRPWQHSGYAWRWSDPKFDSLSPSVLGTIQTVATSASARLHPRLQQLEAWAREKPDRVIPTAQLDDESVARTLQELPIHADETQLISWGASDAVLMPWRTFVHHWSSFCYPSSDDLVVVARSGRGVLSYHHAEYFSWRARPRVEADPEPEDPTVFRLR